MIAAHEIESLVDQIAQAWEPQRIILFGSYACGTPTEDSDIDLMVIRRHRGSSADAGWRIRVGIEVPFGIDVLVRSPAEIRRRIGWGDMFIVDVMKQGIVLHDSTNSRMGQQGRRRLRRRLNSAAVPQAQPV
jgi:predicted nucleotidyltransferase